MDLLSFKDILFQFLVLFSFGCFFSLIFLPAQTIGFRFFSSQSLFSMIALGGALILHFYHFFSEDSSLPLFSYVYVVILVGLVIYYFFISSHKFFLAWYSLILSGLLMVVGLYLHGEFLSTSQEAVGRILYFSQAFASVALVGSVFTSMMLCHWFFVFHKLPIKYLKYMGHVFTFSVIFKIFVTGIVFWTWRLGYVSEFGEVFPLEHNLILLYVRFGIGLFIPLVLSFGSEMTIKIPSNHSAIGILYLAVILVFTGEVLGQYLTLIHQIPL
ncbi:MAG: hypothetical protein HYS98_01840 [Deltaproteobacteria bacterium]|nr:hypothetical protein [Deltaproteobacteria bacterium]